MRKEAKNEAKYVTDPREIPNGYVPLSVFRKKEQSYLIRQLKAGRLRHVRWYLNSGRNYGYRYVDKEHADELLAKAGYTDEPNRNGDKATNKMATVDSISCALDRIEKFQSQTLALTNEELRDQIAMHKEITEGLNHKKKWILFSRQRLINLERHIVTLTGITFGLIEQLGATVDCCDKSKLRERLLLMDRLITLEEWEHGFDE